MPSCRVYVTRQLRNLRNRIENNSSVRYCEQSSDGQALVGRRSSRRHVKIFLANYGRKNRRKEHAVRRDNRYGQTQSLARLDAVRSGGHFSHHDRGQRTEHLRPIITREEISTNVRTVAGGKRKAGVTTAAETFDLPTFFTNQYGETSIPVVSNVSYQCNIKQNRTIQRTKGNTSNTKREFKYFLSERYRRTKSKTVVITGCTKNNCVI